jgi:hypothetical protein
MEWDWNEASLCKGKTLSNSTPNLLSISYQRLLTMLALQHMAVICVTAFMLCTVTTMIQEQRELPVEISPVIIPGTSGECPSDDNWQESRSLLGNAIREIIRNLNISTNPISQICGPGEWRRVFYLNTSRSDQICPDQWSLVTSPVRGCTGAAASCRTAFSDDIFMAYSKVCGRIIGEGTKTPDAFIRLRPVIGENSTEGNYLDGVSVTHGAPGSRAHIWSFGAGHPAGGDLVARCPCDSSNRSNAPLPLAEVGDNYFCDRADELDPLWTGESCASDNPCCSFNNPPYFSVQLPAATTDRIELRICTDQRQGDEAVLVLLAEMYVQ